jgi:Brp/Blh family beta-carotene 15,15'-monooxygenase
LTVFFTGVRREELHAAPPAGDLAVAFAAPARAATVVSITAVGLAVAVQLAVPGGWGRAAWIPLVAGLLLGLPHGAVDHLVPGYRFHWRLIRLGVFAAGYAAVAMLGYLLFHAAPGLALGIFVLLSAWHFGSGETAVNDLRAGRPVSRRPLAALTLGGIVLLLPLARGSAEAAGIIQAVVPDSSGTVPAALTTTALVVVPLAALVLALAAAVRRRWLEAAEVAALLALALVVPPVAAFGIYFGCWHAVRHTARVVAEDPANRWDLTAGRLARPVRRFAVAAALPTTAVLVVLAVLGSAADGWRGFVATDLPLLAALTLPHALVVTWLDSAESTS